MKKHRSFTNEEIARILSEMAAFYDMHGLEYKRRAYELAAADVKIFPENISDIYQREGRRGLMTVPSVGASIATHIEELLKTGRFAKYEEFKKSIPVNLGELLAIDGVGPRTVKELWLRLKIKDIADLENACRQGKLRKLPRFGIKTEQRILNGIAAAKEKLNMEESRQLQTKRSQKK